MLPHKIQTTDKQYVLDLDSLDLCLLSKYVHNTTDDKRFLWSKTFLEGKSTYYEVEIIPEELPDDESFFEPSETVICHICNIDVPQTYFKQHIKSRKHQSYEKLTKKVLDNVSKLISISLENNFDNNKHSENMYYCETCSKVISVKHRVKHNNSGYHLKSKENEKITNTFLEIYMDKQVASENIKSQITSENGKHGSQDNNYSHIDDDNMETASEHNTISESDSSSECDYLSSNSRNNELIPINNPKAIIQVNKTPKTDDWNGRIYKNTEMANFLQYLRNMVGRYRLKFEIPTDEDNCVVVVTPKGFREKVTIEAFQGFQKVGNFVFCQLCKIYLLHDTTEHSCTEDHVKSITQPVNDYFARKLVIDPRWSHCLICNNVVLTNGNHASDSPKHSKYHLTYTPGIYEIPSVIPKHEYYKPNISGTNKTPVTCDGNDNRTYCAVCDIYLPYAYNIKTHIGSKEHQNELKNKTLKDNPKQKQTQNNVTTVKNAVPYKELYCDICKVCVPQGGMEIHELGKPHKNKMLTKTTATDIAPIHNNLPSTSKGSYAKITSQNNNVEKKLTMGEKLIECKKHIADFSSTAFICLVCDLKIPIYDKNIIEHVEGARHKNAIEDMLLKNKVVKISSKMYYCELCKVNSPDFVDHIKRNERHILQTLLTMKEINDKNLLRKYVYEDPLSESPIAAAYRQLHATLLAQNKIVRLINTLTFYCNVCTVKLTRISEIDHMFGERHKINQKLSVKGHPSINLK